MTCKIVPARKDNKLSGGISFAILSGNGWKCVPHSVYWGAVAGESKPKVCPVFDEVKQIRDSSVAKDIKRFRKSTSKKSKK
jgi:hypothetical protein